jgi:hypothetical protein
MTPKSCLVQLRAWSTRPTVVHRLPGRLRIHIPALTRLANGQCSGLPGIWRELLGSLPGIQVTEVNLPTGNVLIRYDPARQSEAEVLAFLRAVHGALIVHWERLAATPAPEWPRVVKRLIRTLRKSTRHRLVLEEPVRIPDDVWR